MKKRPCLVRSVAFCGERITGNASVAEYVRTYATPYSLAFMGKEAAFAPFTSYAGCPLPPPFLFPYPITNTAAPSSRPSRKSASAVLASSSL